MPDSDEVCARCGHERHYHQGNARNMLDRKGCGVTFCHCKKFVPKDEAA